MLFRDGGRTTAGGSPAAFSFQTQAIIIALPENNFFLINIFLICRCRNDCLGWGAIRHRPFPAGKPQLARLCLLLPLPRTGKKPPVGQALRRPPDGGSAYGGTPRHHGIIQVLGVFHLFIPARRKMLRFRAKKFKIPFYFLKMQASG